MAWYEATEDFEGALERWQTTSPRWKNKWFEVCEKIYNSTKKWFDKYVLDPVNKTIQKVDAIRKNLCQKDREVMIAISADCPDFDNSNKTQKCYLVEFFDADGQFICSKVGTTIRPIKERICEELRSKTYADMRADTCIIRRVYNCGDIPAEGLESLFRANYIRKYPEQFKKNDRFIAVRFNLREADKIFENYIG